MRKYSKRTIAAATVGAVAVSGIAYAYWSSTGSGTGSAATASDSLAVIVNQTTSITNLAPGVAPITLEGNFDNPNSAAVQVNSVSATVASVTKGGNPVVGCDASDYTIGGTGTVSGLVPSGNGTGSWSGLTLEFNNKASNQDACKGATVTLAYTAS